ncbi:hypothetical protein ACFV4N_28355 [Actinosynnema sp. NPDC059797]
MIYVARLDGVVSVVDKARSDHPYVMAVPLPRVYRMLSQRKMEAVPLWEGKLVSALIDAGEFALGSRRLDLECDGNTRTVQVIEVSA